MLWDKWVLGGAGSVNKGGPQDEVLERSEWAGAAGGGEKQWESRVGD